jgi:hypothetical protein
MVTHSPKKSKNIKIGIARIRRLPSNAPVALEQLIILSHRQEDLEDLDQRAQTFAKNQNVTFAFFDLFYRISKVSPLFIAHACY